MIKAAIFDLDGTLVDSLKDIAVSVNFALEKFGFTTHEIEKYKYFVGNGVVHLVERALPEDRRDGETHKKVLDTFRKHYAEHYVDYTVPYNGIIELLNVLKQKGIKLAVVTNKPHDVSVEIVNKLLDDYFMIVYGKQEGYPAKPDPALTLKAMSDMNVTPEESVFIGDSGMDAANAVNAGCKGIGVLWGFRTEEELLSNGADYIVSKPEEIIDIIEKI